MICLLKSCYPGRERRIRLNASDERDARHRKPHSPDATWNQQREQG
jgi:hypothetical protein